MLKAGWEATELCPRRTLAGWVDSEAEVRIRKVVLGGFVALLTVGFVYAWRKGIFRWR